MQNYPGLMLLIRRQSNTYIDRFPVIQNIFADALSLKNKTVRDQVMSVLMAGLDNADDSAFDSYRGAEQKEYPSRDLFWEAMFYSSCQSASCFPREMHEVDSFDGRALRWLHKRGLLG